MSALLQARRWVLAVGLLLVGIGAAWFIPGATGRGINTLVAQQRDTVARDSANALPSSRPPVVPSTSTPVVVLQPPPPSPTPIGTRLIGLIGMALIIGIGYAMSNNRKAIRWQTVAWGLSLQILFAIFVLRVPFGRKLFRGLGAFVTSVLHFSYVGSAFVFGELGKPDSSLGVIFAFQILPAIIFVSALFAIMYYLGVMQLVVRAFAVVMSKIMRASGAESLDVAASIFMGQTEAPLTIRPFLPKMTMSELMTVMTAGMAHISGSIMAAYIAFGIEARHLLTAVIMTAPGTIMMSKMFEPETGTPETYGNVKLDIPKTDVNLVDAAARGTGEGLHLMLNVIAMLVSFIALVALTNGGMGWIHSQLAWFPENLQTVLSWVGRPIAWAMGVPWKDSGVIGSLLGTRTVLNEFVAFSQLGPLKASLDPRSFTIASFALAGFANLSSVGIQIGGIGALAPTRKSDLAKLGFRAMLAGTLANFMSATIAGILL
ncbi:MAG TPA: nucleoside transporter C-terminal domain-containing protein [Gemmatimonadales bacterium]|nr:nucleoside transporter C-terminal domain-containing protein [Gemmatimonadales bacterium]